MSKPPRPTSAAVRYTVICFVIILLAGIGLFVTKVLGPTDSKPAASNSSSESSKAAAKVTPTPITALATATPNSDIRAEVAGAVKNPGVYRMQPGDRVEDLIKAAGGLTDEADTNRLDLAVRVRDEMKLVVPTKSTGLPAAPPAEVLTVAASNTPVSVISTPTRAASTNSSSNNGKINVNNASAADLDKLPGIGTTLAARLVEYRGKNGPFKTLDDIRKVPGFGNSVIEKIKDLIEF